MTRLEREGGVNINLSRVDIIFFRSFYQKKTAVLAPKVIKTIKPYCLLLIAKRDRAQTI